VEIHERRKRWETWLGRARKPGMEIILADLEEKAEKWDLLEGLIEGVVHPLIEIHED